MAIFVTILFESDSFELFHRQILCAMMTIEFWAIDNNTQYGELHSTKKT